MNVYSLLSEQVRDRPGADAFVMWRRCGFRRASFGDLAAASAQAAGMLRSMGLRAGDAVLVFVPMSIDLYVALLAIWRLGLTAVFIDPRAGREHIESCARDLPIKALIATPRAHLLRCSMPSLRRIPVAIATGPLRLPATRRWRDWQQFAPDAGPEACTDDTPALLTFTSGSTGSPKATVRTHGHLRAQQATLAAEPGIRKGERVLTGLPMFVLANLACGAANLLPGCDLSAPARVDAPTLVDRVRAARIACIQGSPALLGALAEDCQRRGLTLPEVRRVHTGGAPVFPRLLMRLRSIAPHARITAIYGSTEAEPIACLDLDDLTAADRLASASGGGLPAGRPVATARVRVLPDRWGAPIGPYTPEEFETVCLQSGQGGEIVVAGPHVIPGYVKGVGDAETKFRVGRDIWHRTGDAGRLDADGRLWLLGRCGAALSGAGGVLYPLMVEAAADRHGWVRRSACCRVGVQRALVVEPAAVGAGAADWAGLKRDLAWAGIERILPVDRIPCDRRHNAKVDYPALHRLVDSPSSRPSPTI
jgi:acyl-CoA synthetase (AMP-forming)/AMP-acid ligase II